MENSNRDLTNKLLKQVESFEEKYLNKEFQDKKHFNNELKLLVRNTIFVCEKILKLIIMRFKNELSRVRTSFNW